MYVNKTGISKFKPNDNMSWYNFCLGSLSKDFTKDEQSEIFLNGTVLYNCKCKFNSSTCNCNQKWNNKKCQYECKKYRACKKDYNWNPSMCCCGNSRYLKSIADISVIVRDEIINFTDSVSTNVTSIISTNGTTTMLTNSDDKKGRCKINCYILHTVLLVTILLLIIAIICYHYAKHRSKLKNILPW